MANVQMPSSIKTVCGGNSWFHRSIPIMHAINVTGLPHRGSITPSSTLFEVDEFLKTNRIKVRIFHLITQKVSNNTIYGIDKYNPFFVGGAGAIDGVENKTITIPLFLINLLSDNGLYELLVSYSAWHNYDAFVARGDTIITYPHPDFGAQQNYDAFVAHVARGGTIMTYPDPSFGARQVDEKDSKPSHELEAIKASAKNHNDELQCFQEKCNAIMISAKNHNDELLRFEEQIEKQSKEQIQQKEQIEKQLKEQIQQLEQQKEQFKEQIQQFEQQKKQFKEQIQQLEQQHLHDISEQEQRRISNGDESKQNYLDEKLQKQYDELQKQPYNQPENKELIDHTCAILLQIQEGEQFPIQNQKYLEQLYQNAKRIFLVS